MQLILSFIRRALEKNPYETFCAANGIHPFSDLPMLLMQGLTRDTFDRIIGANEFVAEPLKGFLFSIFVNAKRQLNVVRRVVIRYVRRRRPSQTSVDLSLAPFGKASTRMDVFDRGVKYTFKISDLLNLIHSSLTHAIEFICQPVPIKNPYTGLAFSNSTLYSIYLMLRESSYTVPPLFLLLMQVDFNIDAFEVQYEGILRDHVIKAHIVNMRPEKRRQEIRDMLTVVGVYNPLSNRYAPIFRIRNVTEEELDQFTKWLHLYFLHLYSLNTYHAHVSFQTLIKEMLRFRAENPGFAGLKGRRGI